MKKKKIFHSIQLVSFVNLVFDLPAQTVLKTIIISSWISKMILRTQNALKITHVQNKKKGKENEVPLFSLVAGGMR